MVAAVGSSASQVVVHMSSRTDEEKRLVKYQEAQAMLRTTRSGYRHSFLNVHRINLGRSIRHADAGHLGLLGCPSLVTGDLPERPTRAAMTAPWSERQPLLAMILEASCLALAARLHNAGAGEPIERSDIWWDAPQGAPAWTQDEAGEVLRGLQAFALGLRAGCSRDPSVFARLYATSKIKLIHPIVGSLNWFIFQRTTGLDRVGYWLLALRDGTRLPDYGPAATADPSRTPTASGDGSSAVSSAAAAAGGVGAGGGGHGGDDDSNGDGPECVVDVEMWARVWPWIGLGEAVATAMGEASRPVAAQAWDALEAGESLVAAALKMIQPETAAGDDDDEHVSSRERKRRRRESNASAGGLGAGGKGGGRGGGRGGLGAGRGGNRATRRATAAATAAAAAAAAATTVNPTFAAAAGLGGGGGVGGGGGTHAASAARAAARARVLAMPVGNITRTDCLDGGICFICKRARHDSGTACDLRGNPIA
jgi:hypothetical protein